MSAGSVEKSQFIVKRVKEIVQNKVEEKPKQLW